MIIDGSMSTALEMAGCNLNNKLWTASILADSPEKIIDVHKNYFRDGADCGITCSYQASIPGFVQNGVSEEEAERLITLSVELFNKARDEWWEEEGKAAGRAYPLCLAAVGPYGAYLADGSEYKGNYGISDEELLEFHKRRLELLWNAGADLLIIETQPSLNEALLIADYCEANNWQYWVSFTCRDDEYTWEGQSIEDCAKAFSENHPNCSMIGVNCTKPEYITELIKKIKNNTDLPVGVYPNSGEQYDPLTKTWSNCCGDQTDYQDRALEWMKAGASAVGGCCKTADEHIRKVTKAREIFRSGNDN